MLQLLVLERCFWNMQMSRARPKQRRGCMGGNLAGTRWWPCSIPRTSSLLSSMTESCRTCSRVATHNVCVFFKIFEGTVFS
uniref:Uncharacterized protein n=1 Tax=Zea mays TaxID=4577 RepID=B4FL16_MAIZE|nr:unknown [Zea mays]